MDECGGQFRDRIEAVDTLGVTNCKTDGGVEGAGTNDVREEPKAPTKEKFARAIICEWQ